jgi:hypothetical protein
MLVLLMGGIYDVHRGMTCLRSFMRIGTGVQVVLRFNLSNLDGRNVGITDGSYSWSAPLRWTQVAWYTYRFMKNGTGIEVILRSCLINLKGCNVDIFDGRIYDVCGWKGPRWHDILVCTKFRDDRFRHLSYYSNNLKGCKVGITDWSDLWITPLRWDQTPWYNIKFHNGWFRHTEVVRGDLIRLLVFF